MRKLAEYAVCLSVLSLIVGILIRIARVSIPGMLQPKTLMEFSMTLSLLAVAAALVGENSKKPKE